MAMPCTSHPKYRRDCTNCRATSAADSRRRRARKAAGEHRPMVSAADVRPHLLHLREAGMMAELIAERSGVSPRRLHDILHGSARRISASSADALLAVRYEPTAPRDWVPGAGPRRRLQAFAVNGWPPAELAARLGVPVNRVYRITHGRVQWVLADAAEKIAALYDEMYDLDGPSAVVKRWAEARGWHGGHVWTDETIDDPLAEPELPTVDEVAIELAVSGKLRFGQLRPAERVSLFREQGLPKGLLQRLHISADTAQKWRAKAEQVAA